MNIKHKCHWQALSENLELGLIGGLLASGVDSLWVIMDMIANGVHAHYIIILVGLLLSTLVIGVALIRHHRDSVKENISILCATKKILNKRRMKRRHR